MRKLLLLLILLISFNNLWAQYRSTLQETPQFVRSLLQDDFEPKQTIVETLLHESFSPDKFIQVNNIKHQETWQYEEHKNGGTDSTLLETIDYQYNDIGQVSQEEKNNKLNSSTYKYLYTYNSQGLIEKRTDCAYFHHKGPLKDYVSITEFAYNNSGQLTLNISYDADSVFHYSQKREFDSNGNILKIARNSENKYLYISNVFHYNTGSELEKIDFMGPEKHINYSYTIKTDTSADKKIISVFREGTPFRTYKYNNIQQCVQKVRYDKKGDEPYDIITKIIYNPNGTVNTRLSYVNNELKVVRKIFYK